MYKTIYRTMSMIMVLTLTLGSHVDVRALTVSAAPKTVYVSPTGSDTNSGSATAPYKTLSKGTSVLAAGDTLVVNGTFSQPLTVSKSGTAATPINIIGKSAVLNMGGTQQNGIKVTGSYVNISGFEVTRTLSHAVLISGKHVKFENSSVHHSVLENGSGVCPGTGSWGSAVKVMLGADDVIVRGNTVYENCGEGIGITRGLNILVENNIVRDNFSVNIYLDNSPYSSARNNSVACTGIYLRNGQRPSGIVLAEELYTGWGAQRHDNSVLSNSVTGCYDGIASWVPEVTGGKLINAVVSGNTVTGGTRRSIAISSINQNVLIENNNTFADISITSPAGITLNNNIVIGTALTTATASPAAPTALPTSIPPTATPTAAPVQPTATSIPSTPTTAPTATAVPPTATSTAAPVQPSPIPPTATAQTISQPSAETYFDDISAGFVYSGNWQDVQDQQAYNGSYKTVADTGASVTTDFTGQSFSILYTDGPIYRRMSVYVDGTLVDTITRATTVTKLQQRWDYPGQLNPGTHNIKLVFANGNGTFDAVIVR